MEKVKVRKQFILDKNKIAIVRKLTLARTDTEAIDKVMDIIIANSRMESVLRDIRGKGKIKDIYGRTSR